MKKEDIKVSNKCKDADGHLNANKVWSFWKALWNSIKFGVCALLINAFVPFLAPIANPIYVIALIVVWGLWILHLVNPYHIIFYKMAEDVHPDKDVTLK